MYDTIHAMDLPEGVLVYYLLSCTNLSDEQTAICRATCMNRTYDDIKKQIERLSTSNESSTSTYNTQIEVKAETQYQAQYDESAYYYGKDHDGEEVENVETENTYYIQPGTWPDTSGGTRVASKPMGRLKKNPLGPNNTTYKRWNCHSGPKLLCKLCLTFPPPAMGA